MEKRTENFIFEYNFEQHPTSIDFWGPPQGQTTYWLLRDSWGCPLCKVNDEHTVEMFAEPYVRRLVFVYGDAHRKNKGEVDW